MPIINPDSSTYATELAEYEAFISTSPYGNMMQSIHWLKVKNNWAADLVYVRDNAGSICAAMTIISISNDGERSFMYCRGPVCDFSDTDLVLKLIKEAQPAIEKRNPYLLRIEPEYIHSEELVAKYRELGFEFRSGVEETFKSFTNGCLTMIRWLEGKTEEDIFASFSSRFRGKLRKSYKNGITTEFYSATDEGYPQALEQMRALIKTSLDRHGSKCRPIEYFDRMLKAFSDSRIVLTRDEEGTYLSTCLLVNYNQKSFYVYAGSTTEKRNLYPAAQTNWEAIKYAISRGMHHYDMGDVKQHSYEDALFKFKHDLCGDEGATTWIGALDLVFDEARYRAHLPGIIADDQPVAVVKDLR